MVKIRQPVLLVGESGTSKTATTHNFLKNLNEETNVSHYLYLLSVGKEQITPTQSSSYNKYCLTVSADLESGGGLAGCSSPVSFMRWQGWPGLRSSEGLTMAGGNPLLRCLVSIPHHASLSKHCWCTPLFFPEDHLFIYLSYGCTGSLLLHASFLYWWQAGATC